MSGKTREQKRSRKAWARDKGPKSFLSLFNKDIHDFEVIRANDEILEVIVKKRIHAEIFKNQRYRCWKKLVCDGDYYAVKGFDPKIELNRDKLLMLGVDCCHFFKLKKVTPKKLT